MVLQRNRTQAVGAGREAEAVVVLSIAGGSLVDGEVVGAGDRVRDRVAGNCT